MSSISRVHMFILVWRVLLGWLPGLSRFCKMKNAGPQNSDTVKASLLNGTSLIKIFTILGFIAKHI